MAFHSEIARASANRLMGKNMGTTKKTGLRASVKNGKVYLRPVVIGAGVAGVAVAHGVRRVMHRVLPKSLPGFLRAGLPTVLNVGGGAFLMHHGMRRKSAPEVAFGAGMVLEGVGATGWGLLNTMRGKPYGMGLAGLEDSGLMGDPGAWDEADALAGMMGVGDDDEDEGLAAVGDDTPELEQAAMGDVVRLWSDGPLSRGRAAVTTISGASRGEADHKDFYSGLMGFGDEDTGDAHQSAA